MSDELVIRGARPDDVELIFSLIVALAEYERAPDQVRGNPGLLATALFGPSPAAEAVIAERRDQAVGFAVFHGTFSTWECLPGIWLEDIFVPVEHRREGVGEGLLRYVAQIAVERGCSRLAWAALDWNTPALTFYEKLGAEVLEEWKLHRLGGDSLAAVAGLDVRAGDDVCI